MTQGNLGADLDLAVFSLCNRLAVAKNLPMPMWSTLVSGKLVWYVIAGNFSISTAQIVL